MTKIYWRTLFFPSLVSTMLFRQICAKEKWGARQADNRHQPCGLAIALCNVLWQQKANYSSHGTNRFDNYAMLMGCDKDKTFVYVCKCEDYSAVSTLLLTSHYWLKDYHLYITFKQRTAQCYDEIQEDKLNKLIDNVSLLTLIIIINCHHHCHICTE